MKVLARGMLLLLVVVCTAAPRASDPRRLPFEVTLRMGQAAPCGRGMTIRFQEVLQDSRCPEGVTCVWAGNASVVLTVSRPWRRPVRIELNTNLEPRIVKISNYTIEIVSLSPTRRAKEELDKRAYVVTLSVKSEHP